MKQAEGNNGVPRRAVDSQAAVKGGAEMVARLTRVHLAEVVDYCRKRILALPRLQSVVEKFRIAESDGWLRQAILLFHMAPQAYSPAAEWHAEVGELNFTAGLNVADANDCLCILRDAVIHLFWDAVKTGEISGAEVPDAIGAVLSAFDHALDAQTAAYIRESQRHLQEVNERLEFRQSVFERDLALAQLVQQQFIPTSFASENFRAEVRYVPTAGVGGDHAGVFPVSSERLYITLCDVTGHGIASALAAQVVNEHVRSLLRQIDTTFEYGVEPVALIRELNTLFYTEFQPLGMLLTLFVALFDSKTEMLTYSGAGHPPPLLQCGLKHTLVELRSQNLILGVNENCILNGGQDSISIHPGDRVVFYTDGIIEATDGKKKTLGLHGLRKVVEEHHGSPPDKLADIILTTASNIYGSNESDDMSLILVDFLHKTTY